MSKIECAFDERRTTQAAVYLLKKNGGELDYLKLVKMLYFANRMSVIKWHEPLTGGKCYSLPYGPVVSEVMNLANRNLLSQGNGKYWDQYISKEDRKMSLKRDIKFDDLSAREIKLLDQVFEKINKLTITQLVHRLCHGEKTPEWIDPGNSRLPISYEDILKKVGGETNEKVTETAEEMLFNEQLKKLSEGSFCEMR